MLSKAVVVGQYVPGESPLHALDARTKLLGTLVLAAALFAVASWWAQLVMAAAVAVLFLLARLPLAVVWRGIRPVFWLLVLTVAFNAVLTPGRALAQLGPLAVTAEGLDFGARMGVRLLVLIGTGSLLTLTTSPIELTDGLESLLRPFRRLGVPAHELAMMMTIALRFIPTLLDEADRIARAQASRGADFESGGLARRLRAMAPLLVPLFLSAFRRADELAAAMEARCYRGGEGRTRYRERRFGTRDLVAACLLAALLAGLGWLRWRGA